MDPNTPINAVGGEIRGRLQKGGIVKIVSKASKYKGFYGFVYKVHMSGRFGVVVCPSSRMVSYTKMGVIQVFGTDGPIVNHDKYLEAKEARDEYFRDQDFYDAECPWEEAPPAQDEAPAVVVVGGDVGWRSAASGPTRNSGVDLERLTDVLQNLQRSVDLLGESTGVSFGNMEGTIRSLSARLERVERELNLSSVPIAAGYSGSAHIVPADRDDMDMATGSQ